MEKASCYGSYRGLDPDQTYTIEEVNIDSPAQAICKQNNQLRSGKELMEKGLDFNCKKRFDSAVIYLNCAQ